MADSRGLPAYSGDVVPELPGYRIERQLGRGSMGVVYLAEDVQLRRKVALKILAPTLADDELFRKRFDRESQSAANLDHPNIVPVYAAGEAGGSLYIAMRYVCGGDLRALLDAKGPLSPEQATAIVGSVADALDAAHAQGMIHRDVKPANILIDDRNGQERYYLSDFGITKVISSSRSLTSTGHIVGTIDYIAPEQIQGKPLDGRSDLYALGCVLYQCLTGVVPFPRDDTAALMWAHVHDEISPVTTLRPDLPPQIDSIVAKALAKQPEDRYDTCRELARDLRLLAADPSGFSDSGAAVPAGSLDSSPAPVPSSMTSTYIAPIAAPARAAVSTSPSRRRRWWWFAAGVVVLALIAGSTAGVMEYFNSRFPNAAEKKLLNEVPLVLTMKNSCTRNAEAERDTANVEASVTCTSDGNAANTVTFTKFTSAKALDSRYQSAVATAGVGQSSGDCVNADRAEGTYTSVSNQTSGRVVCYQQRGSSFVGWTDDRVHTLAQATRVDPDYMKLRDWWAGVMGLPTSGQTAAAAAAQKRIEDAQKQAEETKKQAEDAQRQQAEDAQKQAEAAQQQVVEANKRAEDAQRQQAEDAQKQAEAAQQQIAEANKRAEDAQRQQAEDAQKQAEVAQQQTAEARKQADEARTQDREPQILDSPNSQQQTQNNGGSQNNNSGHGRHSGGINLDNGNENRNSGGTDNSNGGANSGDQGIQQMIDNAVQRAIQRQGDPGENSSDQALRQQIEDSVKNSIRQRGNVNSRDVQQLINDAMKLALEQARQGGR